MFCHQAAETIRQKRGSRGYTLIEVLIAMAIFSIGILAVGAMQINSANSNTGARIHTEEYTWVVDQIERLTALDYDHDDLKETAAPPPGGPPPPPPPGGPPPPPPPGGPPPPPPPGGPPSPGTVDQGPYTVSWTVVDDSPVDGAKRITVTATGAHPRARPITIEFIKAR